MKKDNTPKENSKKPEKKLTTAKEMKERLTKDFLKNLNAKGNQNKNT